MKSILMVSIVLSALVSQSAMAQSFGAQMVEEVQQYQTQQGVYAPPMNVEPIPAPTVNMGRGTYMTPDGPMQDMGGGVVMMPNRVPVGTTVNDVPYSQFPEPGY